VSLASLDRAALVAARTHLHPRCIERTVAIYSRTGEHAACWFALGSFGAWLQPGQRQAWLRGLRVVGASYAINYAVKLVVRRRRPELEGLPPLTPTVSRLSFPSAHCTTSFAAARGFGGLVDSKALYGVAILFALSRPYLGVHYPSDVLAGAVLGSVVAEAWPR
jgi:undecaprenyl-diphosphatase